MVQNVGARIKQRRLEAGKSAVSVAEAAEISKGYLSSIENDKVGRPSPNVLLRIADALDTTVGDLLGTEEVRPRARAIPQALRELQAQEGLTEDEIQDLALIEFRGHRPITMSDWRYLLETVKRAFGTTGDADDALD